MNVYEKSKEDLCLLISFYNVSFLRLIYSIINLLMNSIIIQLSINLLHYIVRLCQVTGKQILLKEWFLQELTG